MSSQGEFDGGGVIAFLFTAGMLWIAWLFGRKGTTSRAALAGLVTAKATLAMLAGLTYGAFLHFNGTSTLAVAGIILYFPVGLVIAAAVPAVVYLLALALPEPLRNVAESGARRTLLVANGIALVLAIASFAVGYSFVK